MTASSPFERGGASLAALIVDAPLIARPDVVDAKFEAWCAEAGWAPSVPRPKVEALLGALADHSPYLWRLASQDPARLGRILDETPGARLAACLEALDAACDNDGGSLVEVGQHLRRAKSEVALLVGLADLGGAWDLAQVTGALTHYADRAVRAAFRALLRDAHRAGRLRLENLDAPEEGCGLVVLALGKHGAGELNYSSDIDVIVLFDPASGAVPEGAAAAPIYVRLTQGFARLLSERTGEGYALRVDLRLRPDPASTAVALGLPSALSYYERHGQNWERAAYIKARPIAGERQLGTGFLYDLEPFIWRKYFDYAAIADIHAMKRQIHVAKGHAAIAVAGHDVKLGRGGIREIEFFVQTQQLIFGGRRPGLRGRQTLPMLAALERDGWIGADAVVDLSAAYDFMRRIEHRLQMLDDEQTQRLPSDPEALARFAAFAGFEDTAAFAETFTRHARAVEQHYARLFEHAPGLDNAAGSLVFTGVTDDPETLDTLARMGFKRGAQIAEAVRGWHFGRRAAVQGARAREILTALLPDLLASFARTADPDGALLAFDTALGRMPAATELFAILRSNERLRDLFGDILGSAPRLAGAVAVRPHLLDAAIDPATLGEAADAGRLSARIEAALDPTLPAEDFLDRARDLMQEEAFGIGLRLLSGSDAPERAGQAYSDLATAIVRATFAHVRHLFTLEHGHVPGGGAVVLAMGKLGTREMTAASDLDLIVIYDFDPECADSDGPRSLDASRYFTRLTQRLIAALTVATRRGRLYEVDMRLRPSGRQGPVATQLRQFLAYQNEEAQTWEHMALTRARVIAGDEALAQRVEAAIGAVQGRPRDAERVKADVASMRALVAREKGDGGAWDLKFQPGGLLDLEFLAQALALCAAADHPSMAAGAPGDLLAEAGRLGLIEPAESEPLVVAYRLDSDLLQVIRLTVEGRFEPGMAGEGVLNRIAAAAACPDMLVLEAQIHDTAAQVRAAFERLVGPT